jgi:hippurate hydrolase
VNLTDDQVRDLTYAAEAELAEVRALRRDIHRNPELGLDLPRTQATVRDALDGLGLELRLGDGLSSVVADLDSGRPGPTVLLRADMDALPMQESTGLEFASRHDGRMHACGHDAHTSMLVGAARMLVARRDELIGRVRFMFQPGEEGDAGAALMIREGVLDGVDAAFALHVAPNLRSGTVAWREGAMLAAADEFEIHVLGRGGHASTPQWAVDPVPVAAEIVLGLQSMVTRTVDVFTPAVLTVARLSAGTTHNVIPEVAEMEGTIRTVDEHVRHALWQRLATLADGIAAAHGCSAEVTVREGYPVAVNDDGLARFVASTAAAVVGERSVVRAPAPVMGAEDFSYVMQKVPGVLVFLGACPPEHRDPFAAPACHSNRMVLDEDAMVAGMALHAAVAIGYLRGGGPVAGEREGLG